MTSRGYAVVSPAQSLKVLRKPWAVITLPALSHHPALPAFALDSFILRITAVKVMSDSTSFFALGKIKFVPAMRGKDSSMARAEGDSGTRCSRSAFIRSAGMIQTPAFLSISPQVAPLTSLDLDAQRMANSKARAPVPSTALSAATNEPMSR